MKKAQVFLSLFLFWRFDGMTKVLGIDCSSSTIGYCVLEIDKSGQINFISASYLKPIKEGTILQRIVNTRDKMLVILNKVKPDYIAIEDIVQFMKGKSTAKTIITLTTFNRMISLLSYDFLKKSPELFSVMSIRHGLKLGKILPKKEEMPDLVAKHLGIIFPFIYNKKGKIKLETYDVADGIAVALYYCFVLTGKIKKVKRKTSSVKLRKTTRKVSTVRS
jgi:Holliday junction resolvasome RuvABC endonuclease subunit